MGTSHQSQKKPTESHTNVQREDDQQAQSLSSHHEILQLQRTIGNRATIQRLKKNTLERVADEDNEGVSEADLIQSGQSMEMQRVIQRQPVIKSNAMLTMAPYTTNWRGKKKASLYNTLIDVLKGYEEYMGTKGRTIAGLIKQLDAITAAAQAWIAKHGEGNSEKALAIVDTRNKAMRIKADIAVAQYVVSTDKNAIETLYANTDLWKKIEWWAEKIWVLQENTHFYASTQAMKTVQQGKDIIAQHLLSKKIGATPASPDLFNVSSDLFNEAAILFQRPNAQLTTDLFKALFARCVKEASQVWGDLARKMDDVPQSPNDSFMFDYVASISPDIVS